MSLVWNAVELNSPPNLTYEVKRNVIDITRLSENFSEAIAVLNSQEPLHVEAAMLSRILYRIKTKMRFDKGIMYMAKVNRKLLHYLSMDLASAYKSVKPSCEVDGYGVVYAPSRQMLEWVLVRTQGFAKLFCNIMESCEKAAYYMMCRLHLGHVWDVALICLAIAGRIWTISKYLVLQACKWYTAMKPYQEILQPVGISWLPNGYQFPRDLKEWLNCPSLDLSAKPRFTFKKRESSVFELIDLEDGSEDLKESPPEQFSDNAKEHAVPVAAPVEEWPHPLKQPFMYEEDIGEPVSIDLQSRLSSIDPNHRLTKAKRKRQGEAKSSEVVKLYRKSSDNQINLPFIDSLTDSVEPASDEYVINPKKKLKKMQNYKQNDVKTSGEKSKLARKSVENRVNLPCTKSLIGSSHFQLSSIESSPEQHLKKPKKRKKIVAEEHHIQDKIDENAENSPIIEPNPDEFLRKSKKNKKKIVSKEQQILNKTFDKGKHKSPQIVKLIPEQQLRKSKKKKEIEPEEQQIQDETDENGECKNAQIIELSPVQHLRKLKKKKKFTSKEQQIQNKTDKSDKYKKSSGIELSKPKKKKKIISEDQQIQEDADESSKFKKSSVELVKSIKTVSDLTSFLVKEHKKRKKGTECLTSSMDKLQWNMFEKCIKSFIDKLNAANTAEIDNPKRILKKAKKEILLRIQ